MLPPNSDVARLRQRVADEETAARLGLSGLALSAQHEFITARAARGAAHILELVEQGKVAEAHALMDLPDWGVEEAETARTPSVERTAVPPRKGTLEP